MGAVVNQIPSSFASPLFVGIDVIGGFVTEINVTSPTGIRELDKQFGLNIGDMVIAALERRIGARTV